MRFSLPRLRMPQLSLPRLRLPRLPGMFIFAWLFAALKGWVMGSRPKDNDSLVMYDRMLSMGRFAERPVRAGGPTEELVRHRHGGQIIRTANK